MFDQEFVKQFAELGSNAIMAKVPGPRIASYCMDNEHAGECTEISTEAIRAHHRADNAHGLRCHGEYRGGMCRSWVVVVAAWGTLGREFEDDGFHATVSGRAVRRWPW